MLERLQDSALSQWVVGSDTLLAYPTILTLHTIGLALVVGVAVVIALRGFGVGSTIPPPVMGLAFRFFWIGFGVNLASGLILFATVAADKGTKPVFFIKLALIAAALVVTSRLRRNLPADAILAAPPPLARRLAAVSLLLWAGAIVAGRLMAYL